MFRSLIFSLNVSDILKIELKSWDKSTMHLKLFQLHYQLLVIFMNGNLIINFTFYYLYVASIFKIDIFEMIFLRKHNLIFLKAYIYTIVDRYTKFNKIDRNIYESFFESAFNL